MTNIDAASVESWQGWLALEHEAVWLYGLIGGRLDDLSDAARDAWRRHRDSRDHLTAVIRGAGAEPDGPLVAYAYPGIDSAQAGREAAQTIETKVTIAALGCITDRSRREEVVTAVREAAQAAASWGAQPTAFPGLD